MASAWGDAWAGAWGDSWGETATDPNALRGTAAGLATAQAAPSAIAWLSGSSAGSCTAQAYLELDGSGQPPVVLIPGGSIFARPRAPGDKHARRRKEEIEAVLAGMI